MEISDKVLLVPCILAVSTAIYAICGLSGVYGSRGIKNEYSFLYHGKPAIIQYDDKRFWSDDLWILIDGKEKI